MLLAKNRSAARVLLAGLVLGLAAASVQAQTTLRYKFKEGDTLNYGMDQKMEMKMTVADKDVTMDMTQRMTMTWRVLEVDKDGKAKIAEKIDRIRMTMDGLPGVAKIEYDSKDGKEPEGPIGQLLAPIFKALAEAEFTVTMDPRGEISDVKMPDKLIESLKNAGGAGGGLGDMFSPEALKRMVNQSGMTLPKQAVTKGDSWTQKMEMNMKFGTMKVTNTMTYEGADNKGGKSLEKIGVKPQISLDPDPNAQISFKMKSTEAKGTGYFDNAAGRLVELNVTQNMQTEIGAAGQNITQNIRTTTTLKLKQKE